MLCEICNSSELIKKGGVFICESCGAKYSLEVTKKMFEDGTIEVSKTIKTDTSSELKNLYELARRARGSSNNDNALKYYDMILVKDPSSWEANFYVVFFKAMTCKISEIQSAAISVTNCIPSTLDLVKQNIVNEVEQSSVIIELYSQVSFISQLLYDSARNHYKNIDATVKDQFVQEFIYNVASTTDTMYFFGDCLLNIFEKKYGEISSDSWKQGIKMHNGYVSYVQDKELNKKIILEYAEKVKKYDSSFLAPSIDTSSGGCYIATSIYGSYNCPEVWALRRFRDNTLAKTFFGNIFIKTYYAISPSLVKYFGEDKWFKKMWTLILDKFLNRLYKHGIEKTSYYDKENL
jgi:hypothetical protein